MYYTTTEKVLTALTGIDHTGKYWKDYCDTNAFKVADWFFGGGTRCSLDNLLSHLKVANAIIRNGKNVFYASDLPFEMAGRFTGGMDLNRVIRPTGNTRKVFVDFGNSYGKMVDAREWELTMDIEEFTQLINAIRFYLSTVIMDTSI